MIETINQILMLLIILVGCINLCYGYVWLCRKLDKPSNKRRNLNLSHNR